MLPVKLRQFRFAVLGLVLLTIVTRLPSLLHPQPIDDEGMYSVMANEIVDGGRLYVDAVDRKPPLMIWTYAGIYELAGKYNWPALHLVALTWTLLTMAGIYAIAARSFDRNTGLIAALLYSIFQPWALFKNLAFNGEMLMNLPIVWAWAIGLRPSSSKIRLELFVAGALLAAAFLLKQPAAIAAVPLGIYLLLPSYRKSRGLSVILSFVQASVLTLGFIACLGVVAAVLQAQGTLHEAIYWTVVDHKVPYVFWKKGVLFTLAFVGACLPLLLGAATALRDKHALWSGKEPERTALLGLLVASAIGAAAGARFYEHYYIQLIPPLALLAAPYYAALWTRKIQPHFWLLRPPVTYLWLTITVIAFFISHRLALLARSGPLESGRYLLEHSAPNDRIFVWGHKAKIFLDARRRPASRFILSFPLTGSVFGGPIPGLDTSDRIVPGSWDLLKQDFAQHPPAYIVDLYSEPGALYPVQNFPFLAQFIAQHYQPVAHTEEGVIYQRRDRIP